MNRKIVIFVFSLMVAVVFASSMFFVVDEEEQAVISQFGEPVKVVNGSGLKVKVPFVQKVASFSAGVRKIEFVHEVVEIGGQDVVIFNADVDYKIVNPMLYYKTVKNEDNFRSVFLGMLESEIKNSGLKDMYVDRRSFGDSVRSAINKNVGELGVDVVAVNFANIVPAKIGNKIVDR